MQFKPEVSEMFSSEFEVSVPVKPRNVRAISFERPRNVLESHTAREIFHLKTTHNKASLHAASQRLASKYGVSSKAIRDIWKGRSWLDATYDLWNVEDRPARRIIGRPKGRKDSKPRMRGNKTKPELESPNGLVSPITITLPRINTIHQMLAAGFQASAGACIPLAPIQCRAEFQASAPTFIGDRISPAPTMLSPLGGLLASFVAGFASPYSCTLPQPSTLQLPPLSTSQPTSLLSKPLPSLASALALRGAGLDFRALPPQRMMDHSAQVLCRAVPIEVAGPARCAY